MKINNEIKEFILANYKGVSNKDLTERVNAEFGTDFTIRQIQRFKNNNHLLSGLTGRFEKGQTPFNKGKKWSEWMSLQGQKNSLTTCYKKGNINHYTWKDIGSERTNKDGYIEIKTTRNKWELKHRFIYEQLKGKIPKNSVVIFADNDNRNFDIDNLLLVTRNELLILNKNNLIKSVAECTKTGLLLAKYVAKVREKKQ